MAGITAYTPAHPGIDEMYHTPYGVLTSYTFVHEGSHPFTKEYEGAFANKVHASVGGNYAGMKVAIQSLTAAIEAAAATEEARETALLQRYINLIPPNTKLRPEFEALIAGKKYSQAFDTLKKTMSKMYDFNKTLKENQDFFTQINDLYLTGHFIHGLMDELGRSHYITNESADFAQINLDITGAKLVDNVIKRVEEKAKERLNKSDFKKYKVFLDRMKDYINEIFISQFGVQSLSNTLNDLEKNDLIKAKRKDSKYATVPLNRLIYNQVWGLLNGMAPEVIIDLNGGVQTGEIRSPQGQIKTDDVEIMDATGELTLQSHPELKKELSEIETKYDLDDFLQRGAFENNFIIMTSAKDQSLSKDFNNQFAGSGIKFAEKSGLDTRINDIRAFASVSGAGGVDDLIFALANLSSDMVCAGEDGSVKQALGALCANWMFDDFGELVVNVPMQNSANKVCVYYISGWYYTLSDILKRTVEKIKKLQNNDLVAVNLTIPKKSAYTESLNNTKEGLERWEYVRADIMKNTKLGFELKTKNLFNNFFSI